MSQVPDYYALLEVHPTASREVIDAAYRKLAAKYHPDVNSSPDAVDRMKRINEAYEVLTDPVKRASYNRYRREHPFAASNGISKRRILIAIGVILLVLMIARLKVLGIVLLALIVLIWLLARTKR